MADFQSFLFQNMQMIGFEDELQQSTPHRQQQNADDELPPPPSETDMEIAVETYVPKGDNKKPLCSKVSFTELHHKTSSSTCTTSKSNLTSKISFSSVDSDINRSVRMIDKYDPDNLRRNAKYSDHSSKKSLANISTITTETFLSAKNSKSEICQFKFDEFHNIEEILSDKSEAEERLPKSPVIQLKMDPNKPRYLLNFEHFDDCDDSSPYNAELHKKEKIYMDDLDENESSDHLDLKNDNENQETLCYVNNTTNNYNNNLSSQLDNDDHTYISLNKPNKFYEEKRNSLFESNVIESTNIELNEYSSRRSPNSSLRDVTSPGPLLNHKNNQLFVSISDSKFRHSITSSGDEREILSPKPLQQHKSSELVKSFKYRSISPPKLVSKKTKPTNNQHSKHHKSSSRLDTLNMSSESLNSLNFNYQIRSAIFHKKPPIINSSDQEEEEEEEGKIKTPDDDDEDDEDRMSINSSIIQRTKSKNMTDLDLNDETRLNDEPSENEENEEENSLESTAMEPFLVKFEEELLKSSKTEMIKDFTNLKREKMIKNNNLKKCLNEIKNLTSRKSKKRDVDSELITESPLYDETTAPATPDLIDELRRMSKSQIPWENIDPASGELLLSCILENSSKDKEGQAECPSVYSKNGHKISQNQVKKWCKILEKMEKNMKRPSTTQSNKKLSGKEFLMNKKRQLMSKMSRKKTKTFNEITNSCNEISKKYSDISRSVSKLYANVIHDDANTKKSKSATNLKDTSGKTLRKNAVKDESVASKTHSDLIETQHDCTSNDLSTCSEIDSSLEAEEERMSEKCLDDNKKFQTTKKSRNAENKELLEKSEYINEEFFKSLHKKFFEKNDTNKNASVTKLSNSNNKSSNINHNNSNNSKSNNTTSSSNNNNNGSSKENANSKSANSKKPSSSSSTDDKPSYPDHFYNEINENLDRFLDLANKNNRLNKEKTKPKAEKAEQSNEKNETIKKPKRPSDDLNTSQMSANKNSKLAHSNSLFSIAAPTQDDTLFNLPMGNLKRPLISLAKLKSPERKILYKEWFTIIKKMEKDPKFDLETLVRTRGRFTEHERISYRDKLLDKNQRLRCAKSEPNFTAMLAQNSSTASHARDGSNTTSLSKERHQNQQKIRRNYSANTHDMKRTANQTIKSESFSEAIERSDCNSLNVSRANNNNNNNNININNENSISNALKLTLQKSDIHLIKEILNKKKDKGVISDLSNLAFGSRTKSPKSASKINTLGNQRQQQQQQQQSNENSLSLRHQQMKTTRKTQRQNNRHNTKSKNIENDEWDDDNMANENDHNDEEDDDDEKKKNSKEKKILAHREKILSKHLNMGLNKNKHQKSNETNNQEINLMSKCKNIYNKSDSAKAFCDEVSKIVKGSIGNKIKNLGINSKLQKMQEAIYEKKSSHSSKVSDSTARHHSHARTNKNQTVIDNEKLAKMNKKITEERIREKLRSNTNQSSNHRSTNMQFADQDSGDEVTVRNERTTTKSHHRSSNEEKHHSMGATKSTRTRTEDNLDEDSDSGTKVNTSRHKTASSSNHHTSNNNNNSKEPSNHKSRSSNQASSSNGNGKSNAKVVKNASMPARPPPPKRPPPPRPASPAISFSNYSLTNFNSDSHLNVNTHNVPKSKHSSQNEKSDSKRNGKKSEKNRLNESDLNLSECSMVETRKSDYQLPPRPPLPPSKTKQSRELLNNAKDFLTDCQIYELEELKLRKSKSSAKAQSKAGLESDGRERKHKQRGVSSERVEKDRSNNNKKMSASTSSVSRSSSQNSYSSETPPPQTHHNQHGNSSSRSGADKQSSQNKSSSNNRKEVKSKRR